jgi:mannose-1-phosphate guanylyltransferase
MFERWALVLAAGEGSRLRSLTSLGGTTVPKQFCSLHSGPSLLYEALCRARTVASNLSTCAVVAEHHRRWWQPSLWSLPASNVLVQPQNRGTAHGILLPLLYIAARDPSARLVILPSDHHIEDESVLARSLRLAIAQLTWRFQETILLGLEPEESDPELGYILPGSADEEGAFEVRQFIEKPTELQARELIARGGLWNSFIIASSVQALLALFRRRIPQTVRALRAALRSDAATQPRERSALAALYERLPTLDFSRDILQGQEEWLRVLPVPHCGWSDLGTPRRVGEALRRAPREGLAELAAVVHGGVGCLSLADQHARLATSAG